jgi:hypothetical protein
MRGAEQQLRKGAIDTESLISHIVGVDFRGVSPAVQNHRVVGRHGKPQVFDLRESKYVLGPQIRCRFLMSVRNPDAKNASVGTENIRIEIF